MQSFRFSGRFTVTYEVDETLLQNMTLKIILQPLVENAIFHGLEGLKRIGRMHIRIFEKNSQIIFQVKDNGKGMTHELIKEILNHRSEDKTFKSIGIGTSHINERIKNILRKIMGYPLKVQLTNIPP